MSGIRLVHLYRRQLALPVGPMTPARVVGHRSTTPMEIVHRKQPRPVITDGLTSWDALFADVGP
ncbi:hypothetical protein G4Z16_24605 [Streptomyces bathyalis]|uniref:Uncharacterized protein n=1 Tax=Streptomyces bathyalis TaxID=2710756 RepID=A0A7T1T280_9ACTN|nr:hypothetical protein [Streptomyces bathyalis]QPP05029.1 hypothetical protein G4Z16_24605 [Streptomyces bathyalis]